MNDDLIFSTQFSGVGNIDIGPQLVSGDWEILKASISLKASASGAQVVMLPSIDGGQTFLNSGYSGHWLYQNDPSTGEMGETQTYPGPLFSNGTLAGAQIDGDLELLQPNFGSAQKHSRLRALLNTGSYSSWQLDGEHQFAENLYGCMFNALRLQVSSGMIEGRLSLRGERNSDVFPAPALPIKKVAIAGPSLVFQGGYCFPLQSALQAKWTSNTVVVRNFGSSGQSSFGGIANLNSLIASNPDVVIIAYCATDSFPANNISQAQSAANYHTMIVAIKAALPNAKIYVMTDNPMIDNGATEFPNLLAYYANGRSIAANESVGLIDVTPAWGTMTEAQFQNADGVHPTPAANLAVTVPTIVTALTS